MVGSLAETIHKQELNYSQKAFIPRGLTNRGNWCYINAVSFDFMKQASILVTLNNNRLCKFIFQFYKMST